MKPNPDYRSGRHCVFLLHAHLVFTTKYRKRVFERRHIERLRDIFQKLCSDAGVELAEMDGESNHVHLLVNFPPSASLSVLVNSLKGVSSRRLRQEFPELEWAYKRNALWSRSYFAASVGGAPLSILKKYIENQKTPD